MPQPSAMDQEFYKMGRAHIAAFRQKWQPKSLMPALEIGPEHDAPWLGADTLDLKPGCTYQGDITQRTSVRTSAYSTVIAMDVLEHVIDPFAAVREIDRILQPGGLLIASAPFNFRIHGPIPDLWRFNQWSWQVLLKDFKIIEMDVLDTPGRPLMPLHINIAATRGRYRRVEELTFERIER